ncbi:hypothetical protein H6G76_35065 [Nostoc sp. FACHB-152]|uniref:hypothetical protein n=1 Tax=Nostoc sp. FACHB-152 TaxID=2692837 RepID=UPI0016888B69|nr:hypothetical protein [Nostoc sp. FACHB-152]MBD2452232.1 hypothetical protein [Nostoc sp. FACHB-152]
MPKNWTLKVDQFFNANPHCIIATVHVDSFPSDLPLEPNIPLPFSPELPESAVDENG